jgi:ligand-binding sensor domain-containing protein/anti-sigma regulatory factor (Ser/Thr protein kinase)
MLDYMKRVFNAKLIIILLLFFINGKVLFAQSFAFKNYTTNDGLPSSETYFSVQDEKGFMWFATDRGVARFDGYNFEVFTTEDGIPDNTVFEIIKDKKNRLWFKGFSSQLGYYEKGSFYSYKYNNIVTKTFPSVLLNNVVINEDGSLWYTKYNPLLELEGRTFNIVVKIAANGTVDTSYTLIKNDERKVFISDDGSSVYTGDAGATLTSFHYLKNKKKIAEINHEFVKGSIVTAKLAKGNFISNVGRNIVKLSEGKIEKLRTCKEEVIHLFVDNTKNIWIGYREKGYECLLAESNYTKAISGLNGLTISSVYQDNEGGMWLTSLEKGIFNISPQRLKKYLLGNDIANKKIKKVKKIVNVNGSVFLRDNNNEIFVKEKGKALFEYLSFNSSSNLYLRNDIEYKKNEGVYVLLPISKKTPKQKIIRLKNKNSSKIFLGRKFIYTDFPKGINKYSKSGELVNKIHLVGLSRIWTVFEKSNADLLIGTLNGLYLYKNSSNTIIDLKTKNPLFKYRINDIKQLYKDYIIVATIGGGVLVFNEKDLYNVKQYKTTEGLPSLMCNTIWAENDSTVWIGTNKGICIINNILNTSKTKVNTININNGLTSNEVFSFCNIGDEIWVATTKGVSIIDRHKVLHVPKKIPIYIRKIIINGNEVQQQTYNKVKYSDNNIIISYIGINFQYNKKLKYKYRFKNREKKWNYTQNLSVVYSSLPAGEYIFEVGVVNPVSGASNSYATYSFTILPPYWQTTWFIVSAVIASLLLIAFFVRYRINFVREQEQLKHELNSSRNEALRGQMNPHFIYNSLNAIQNYILKNDTEASASFLSKFSQLMRQTFNNTSEESVPLAKELEALELYAELENLRFSQKFKLHIHVNEKLDKNITKVPPLIMQPFIENAILHGLLNKQDNGNIWVDIKLEVFNGKKAIEVSIKDDGIGLKNAEKINERKSRFRNPFVSKNNRENSGIKTTKARIQQIWGKNFSEDYFKMIDLELINNSSTGTLVLFYLPVYD